MAKFLSTREEKNTAAMNTINLQCCHEIEVIQTLEKRNSLSTSVSARVNKSKSDSNLHPCERRLILTCLTIMESE
jgi:hypothetical protein